MAPLVLLVLAVAACDGDDAGGDQAGGDQAADGGGATDGERDVVRFAFERDAVMDYLVETGELEG